ncbi:MAG: hypothetical protein LBF16_05355 [Pseudomonadales bacterium]|jgi:hypothetical protein|nr:hypothetical protein [Pseudomonadales bacterium]
MSQYKIKKIQCLALAVLLALPWMAQAQRRTGESKPTPRYPDGSVNFGPAPGERGHWDTGVGNLSENFVQMNGAFLVHLDEDLDKVAPFQPWARALVKYRLETLGRDDPHPHCMPNGGPRQFHTPVGIEITESRDRSKIYVLSGGGPHSWRTIYMDGREHPSLDDYDPTYFGHSIGKWEGDTLVVDSVHFNERFWFARRPTGMVHTDALHLIERLSRPDYNTLHYEVTIDDPKAYTRPWTASWNVPWIEEDIEEYFCQDYNLDVDHIVGPGGVE